MNNLPERIKNVLLGLGLLCSIGALSSCDTKNQTTNKPAIAPPGQPSVNPTKQPEPQDPKKHNHKFDPNYCPPCGMG